MDPPADFPVLAPTVVPFLPHAPALCRTTLLTETGAVWVNGSTKTVQEPVILLPSCADSMSSLPLRLLVRFLYVS
ncbi:unnamed protein product [Dibothriocephalus latus]|uniref:Uncharacterized protein n=1 Tax=Dibothriocephalus latus TaxID=60516 RepID=A0A3P6PHT9_DIBLA|nr:unnamed protein product [Dibothriocephalus latus]